MNRHIRNIFIFVFFSLLLGGVSVFLYANLIDEQADSTIAMDERKGLLETLAELVVLPEGEEPIIASINSMDALKDKEFFADAKVGDKVIIYVEAQKAILFDPVLREVKGIAPISF